MDYLALFISGKLMKRRVKPFRYALAAALGALYGVAEVCFDGNRALALVTTAACAFVMCLVASDSLGGAARMCAVFCGVSFGIGGAMTALFELINQNTRKIKLNGSVETLRSGIPPGMFVILAIAAAILTYVSGAVKRRHDQKPVEVKIVSGEREAVVKGLLTTEINVRAVSDPSDRWDETLRYLFSGEMLRLLTTRPAELDGDWLTGETLSRGLRLLPMKTASGSTVVFGVKVKIYIGGNLTDALIAGSGEENLPRDDDGKPMAIVPETLWS